MSFTLQQLIDHYRNDPGSTFSKLQYQVRVKQERLLSRIAREHGSHELQSIRAPTLIWWHRQWESGGKVAMARSLFDRLRVLFKFGATILVDQDCRRLRDALEEVRLQNPAPRFEIMSSEHASAIRTKARNHFGWPSISLAQAFQFECPLFQKDVIGELLPSAERGVSDVTHRGQKWLRGIRWEEIDDDLILRHATSEKSKLTEVDLKLTQMVLEELQDLAGAEPLIVVDEISKRLIVNRHLLPTTGPVVLCDITAMPWTTAEYRRKWALVAKKAGVPSTIKNRHSFRRPRV